MYHKQKYLKYKFKYIKLKNQIGGTKEENNDFILHGTNFFYIDDIKKYGLNGKYNQKIYDIIKKNWPIIRYLSETPYVDWFIIRQKNIRECGEINVSFTGQYSVAEEYSDGVRQFGEGPSRFLNTLKRFIYTNKGNISEEMMNEFKYIEEASENPGIILAINKNDFNETKYLSIDNLYQWEYTFHFPIPPDKLYIRRDKNDYILLLSKEGEFFINQKKLDLEQKKIVYKDYKKNEQELVNSLKEWETVILSGPILYRFELKKGNGIIRINAQYDTYDEEKFPYYLQLKINNSYDININVIIKNIIGTTEYNSQIVKMVGFDLFINNIEFKEKFKIVVNGIMDFIPEERKIIYKNIIKIFPYLSE